MRNIWLDGIMGVVIGDALGCPVQFMPREKIAGRAEGAVGGMESGGVFQMPKGTWTDDSSMTLATLSSIINKGKLLPEDVMAQFLKWEFEGRYTPFGKAFDQGNACITAIHNYKRLPDINSCGCTGEHSNGNGSLMRIMPACLYYYEKQQKTAVTDEDVIGGIHVISGLTHAHMRSKICCGLYYFMAKNIIDVCHKGKKPELSAALQAGIDEGLKIYGREAKNRTELSYLSRLFNLYEFKDTPENKILSTGYVIDTIEAAVWCLITTASFKECLLKAVNLGDDADTVGAVAGGLAGLYYGYDAIPEEWLSVIQRREWIEDLCEKAKNMSYL